MVRLTELVVGVFSTIKKGNWSLLFCSVCPGAHQGRSGAVTLPSKSLRRPTDQGQTFPSGLEHRGAGLRLFQYLVCSGVQAAGRQRAYSKVLEVCLSRWPLQMGRTGQLMWQLQPPWGGDSASVLSGHVSPATGQGHSGRAAPTAGGPHEPSSYGV